MTVPLPYRVVGAQALAVFAVVLGMLFLGTKQAGSAALGGAAIVLPNAYFAWAVSRRLEGDLQGAARRVFGQGFAKFAMTVGLLAAVLGLADVEPLGFFGAFGMAVVSQGVAPLLDPVGRKQGSKQS